MLTCLLVISLAFFVHGFPSTTGNLSHRVNGVPGQLAMKTNEHHVKRSTASVQASGVGMARIHGDTSRGSKKAMPAVVSITSSSKDNEFHARPMNLLSAKPVLINMKLSSPNHDSTALVAEKNEIKPIKHMASIASLCYRKNLVPTDSLGDMVILNVVEEGGYLAFVAIDKSTKDVIISIRGATGPLKWIDNLHWGTVGWQFPFSNTEGVQVHQGYSHIWNLLRMKVFWVLETPVIQHHIKRLYPTSKVLITGHSLGGAAASIAAMDIVNRGIVDANKIELTTFGSPRVGNAQFANTMDQMGFRSLIRVINEDDTVPYFPGAMLGFRHFKGERRIVGGKVFIEKGTESPQSTICPFLPNHAHFGLFVVRLLRE